MYAFTGNILLAALPDPLPPDAASCGNTLADLDANEDVNITNEMRTLAETLGYSPVKIFQYVSNQIGFEPYWGSLKGAEGTLVSGSGNDTDQASLLIALLRASKIPARYVQGTIQFDNEDPRLLDWLGVKTFTGANGVMGRGLINPSYTPAGSKPGHLEFKHVWVEACVPYRNYRGAVAEKTGYRWIPLDPSFKERSYQNGIAINVDFDYAGYLASRQNGPDSLPQEKYLRQVEAWIKSQPPGYGANALKDAGYAVNDQPPHSFDILPASPPYRVKNFISWGSGLTAEVDTVPDTHRYKLAITTDGLSSPAVISLPKDALHRITFAYASSSTNGAFALPTVPYPQPGYYMECPSGISSCFAGADAIPQIKIEGNIVVTGNALPGGIVSSANCFQFSGKTLCTITGVLPRIYSLSLTLTLGGQQVNKVDFKNKIKTTDYMSLQAFAFQVSDRLLQERAARLLNGVRNPPKDSNGFDNLDETVGEFLHLAGLKYMRYFSDAGKRIARIDGGSGWSGNHLGLTAVSSDIDYVFDLPYAISSPTKNFLVDVPGGQSRNVDLSTGNSVWKTFLLTGYAGSAYESYLWQENAKLDAVSTVRGMQYARESGIEILTLTPAMCAGSPAPIDGADILGKLSSNANSTLNYTSQNITDIRNLVCASGYTVTLPRSLIQYQNWLGLVYFSELNNGTSMKTGFIIGGAYHGGYTVGNYTSLCYTCNLAPIMQTLPTDLGGWRISNPSFNFASPSAVGSAIPVVSSLVNFGNSAGNIYGKDPVNMVTGNMYHTERDISIQGRGLPFVLERSYNSRDKTDGPFGIGWTHSFNHYLTFNDAAPDGSAKEGVTSSITWVDGTGAQKFIAMAGATGAGLPAGTSFTPPKGYYFTGQRNANGTYSIREKNGLTYTFESVNGAVGDKARLVSVADRNDNTLILGYAGNGRSGCNSGANLAKVTDALGRHLDFCYDANNHLTDIYDWTDRHYQYVYDDNGDLREFRNPLSGSDPVSQLPVKYTYYTVADGVNVSNLLHAMKSYTLPRGNSMTFEYYENGRVFRHTDTLGETAAFTFNDFRRETVMVDERGLERRYFFDADGNPLQTIEEQGSYREYTYDPTDPGKRLTRRDPMGMVTGYAYDANGNVTKITQPSSATQEFYDFNAFNQPRRIKDMRGNWTILRYDAKGNLTDEIHTSSAYTPAPCPASDCAIPLAANIVAWSRHQYDIYGNPTKTIHVKDFSAGTGSSVETAYDTNGLYPVSVTRRGDKNGDGVISADEFDSAALEYDTLGRLKVGIDKSWHPITLNYDSVNRVTSASDPTGRTRNYAFDSNGNRVHEELVANGNLADSATWQYDLSDRRSLAIDAAGNATRWEYDPAGNSIKVTDPDNYSVAFEYDAMNRPVLARDKAGHTVATAYQLDGQPRVATDPEGNSIAYEYYDSTKDGRLKRILDPMNRATSYDYDAAGNVVSVTDNQGYVSLGYYDELNRPVRQVGPAVAADAGRSPVACTRYDALGHIAEIWAGATSDVSAATCDFSGDPNIKKQVSFQYDDFDRKLKETDALGNVQTWQYDRYSNVIQYIDAKGQTTVMEWDYGHLLKKRTVKNANGSVYRTYTYTRNPLDQVTRTEVTNGSGKLILATNTDYDSAHRVKKLTDLRNLGAAVFSHSQTYSYSPGGLLNTTQHDDGARTDYLYDPVGRLIGIWAPNDDYVVFAHDKAGRLTEKWLPNGITARYEWNADNTLATLTNRVGDTDQLILTRHSYGYNGLGRKQTALDRSGLLTQPALNQSWSYDALDNRVAAAASVALFDAANQLIELRNGSATGTLLSAFVYDANGNLSKKCQGGSVTRTATNCTGKSVTTLTWDAEDRLVGVSTPTGSETYTYDAEGRRINKTSNGVATNDLYDGADITAEVDNAGRRLVTYTHGPNMDDPLIRITPNQTLYYHADGLGSIVATSNPGGSVISSQLYDAWGNRTNSSGTIPTYGYTGREPDATGLIYYRARYYDPSIGRFISRDPAGMPDGINRYAYVGNDPVNLVDPSGLVDIMVPGTNVSGKRDSNWWQPGSDFAEKIHNITNDPEQRGFRWDGGNSDAARRKAAAGLASMVNNYLTQGKPVKIFAHSHGGNVVALASHQFFSPIDLVVTMGTPVLPEYRFDMNKVKEGLALSSPSDSVQTNGGNSMTIPFVGEVGSASRQRPEPGFQNVLTRGFDGHSGYWRDSGYTATLADLAWGSRTGSQTAGTQSLQSMSNPPLPTRPK